MRVRAAKTPKASDPHAALVLALGLAEAMARGRGVDPSWALGVAARAHAVDPLRLATLWLDKLLGCDRARAALEALRRGDAAAHIKKPS